MKKLFAFLILTVLVTSAYASYDFSAVCETGQTLYYAIRTNYQVSLIPPGMGNWNGYSKPIGDLIIPETVEHEGIIYTVANIWNYTFKDCTGLTSVEIPNSVTIIRADSFNNCTNLFTLIIGSSVNTIDNCAFVDCTSLQTIYCHAQRPPTCNHIPGNSCEFFQNTPTDIPVYVSCFTIDQYQADPDWSQFTNLQAEFNGTFSLTVGVNHPELGTAEIVSIPEDCDSQIATVRATANPNHRFSYWKRGVSIVSFDSEYTFVLDENYSLTAHFDCSTNVETIAYPDHVIGRIINTSGEVTNEYLSDFIYNEDGVMTRYEFPSLGLTTSYSFENYPTMPSSISIHHYSGHPEYWDDTYYTYENNKLIHMQSNDYMESTVSYYDYYYDDSWHLTRLEQTVVEFGFTNGWGLRLYEYENNYRTRHETYYYSYDSVNFVCKNKTTNHYNERQQLLSSQTDTYNSSGDTTSVKLKTYSYTPSNKTDRIITQSLVNGEWVNSSIIQYVYDSMNRVVEYLTGSWSNENQDWNITKKTLYDFDDENQKLTVSFRKKDNDEWGWDAYSGQDMFYESDLKLWNQALKNYNSIHQFEFDLHYVIKEITFPWQSEWFYKLEWDNGTITYQHLEYTADTTINNERPKVIVRSNTQYDRDEYIEVTHEYILEQNNIVYWWNKDLEEFTTLYDYNADTGNEWEIKVGMESIIVHVDSVGIFEYDGETRKMLHISDAGNIFNGDIVVGYGHMTSFFPEKLMRRDAGFTVNGLRCYWVEDALLYHNGDEDCDAIYSDIHSIDEDGPSTPSTGSGTAGALVVYPNPTNGVLFVETRHGTSLPDQTAYIITNLMGQTLLQGRISAETQQIDVSTLPAGLYFISVGETTLKFVVK